MPQPHEETSARICHRVASEDEDPPRSRPNETGYSADQRRLAGAVGTEQAEEAPRWDPQIELVEGTRAVRVGLADTFDEKRSALAIEVA